MVCKHVHMNISPPIIKLATALSTINHSSGNLWKAKNYNIYNLTATRPKTRLLSKKITAVYCRLHLYIGFSRNIYHIVSHLTLATFGTLLAKYSSYALLSHLPSQNAKCVPMLCRYHLFSIFYALAYLNFLEEYIFQALHALTIYLVQCQTC